LVLRKEATLYVTTRHAIVEFVAIWSITNVAKVGDLLHQNIQVDYNAQELRCMGVNFGSQHKLNM
jgi:hypothetical protein